MGAAVISGVLIPFQWGVALFGIHLYYPMIGALWARLSPPLPAPKGPSPRLAVLIAAHDEEAVIGGCLASLASQQWPAGEFDIFVVADGCSDRTAEVARRTGATVHERRPSGPSTKGRALAWLWAHIPPQAYGGVVVLDADNRADPHFLAAIAAELSRGQAVAQGLRRPLKASANGLADLDALTEVCTHRIGAAGRVRLGLNAPIMGSGVAYDATLFDRLITGVGETLVEDCEWMARLALAQARITWTDRAVIYDEKTHRADAMGAQRRRWVAGRGRVARTYTGSLLRHAWTRRDFNALDLAAVLVAPPRVLLVAAMATLAGLGLACPDLPGLWPAWLWLGGLAGFGAYVVMALWLDGATTRDYVAILRGGRYLPRFAWQMARASWQAARGTITHWVPTPHGRP